MYFFGYLSQPFSGNRLSLSYSPLLGPDTEEIAPALTIEANGLDDSPKHEHATLFDPSVDVFDGF